MIKDKKDNKDTQGRLMLTLCYSLLLLLSPDRAAQFSKIFKIKQKVKVELLPDRRNLSQPELETK